MPVAGPSDDGTSSLPRRISAGTAWLLTSRAATTAASVVAWGVLARVLSTADFGRVTFYLALTLVLDCLADLGTGSAALAGSAGEGRRLASILPAVRRLRAGTTLLCCLGWVAVVLAFDPGASPLLLLAGLHFPTRTWEASSLVFQNEIRLRVPALVRTAVPVLRLSSVLLLAQAGVRSIEPYLVAFAALAAASNLSLHLLARRRLVPHAPTDGDRPLSLRALFAIAWPIGLASLAQAAYFHVDNVYVRGLSGAEEVGLYNAAVKLFGLGALVPALVTQVALPWLAARGRSGELGRAQRDLLVPLLVYTATVSLVLGLIGPPLLRVAFGAGFEAAAPSLRWLAVALVAVGFGAPALTSLVALTQSGTVLRITGIGLLVNLVGNTLLVPRLGAEGAALATLVTEAWVAWAARRSLSRLGHSFSLSLSLRFLVGLALAVAIALATHSWVS